MSFEYFHNIYLSINHLCYAIIISEAPTTTQEIATTTTSTTGKDFNESGLVSQY